MRVILPLILGALGAGGGTAAGVFLRPEPMPPAQEEASQLSEGEAPDPATDPLASGESLPIEATEFTRLNNQFIIPVLEDGEVRSLVVMSLSVQTVIGARPVVFAREPKLRDAFLQVMFDHANAGGFDETFTAGPQLTVLRQGLWEAARTVLGADVIDVLVTDIARQDR